MELRQIKELMAAMGRTGTKRLTLKREDFELVIERDESGRYIESNFEDQFRQVHSLNREDLAFSKGSEMPANRPASPIQSESKQEQVNQTYITSPMVGTFYVSPAPEDPPFVKIGDKVDKNTIVCIIEAMKVMNDIKAGATGAVAELLVESGHPVEFGTKLFRLI